MHRAIRNCGSRSQTTRNPWLSRLSGVLYRRVMHAKTLRRFGLTEDRLPLLRLDLLNFTHPFSVAMPPPPPPPSQHANRQHPHPPQQQHPQLPQALSELVPGARADALLSSSTCSSPWCAEFDGWVEERGGKFMRLWGSEPWVERQPGEQGCWYDQGATFFTDVLNGTGCDRNWMEGALGGATSRPGFAGPAPALLGFDATIWEFCSRAAGQRNLGGFSQEALATRCVLSNNNILRVIRGWSMCQNLQWLLCTATGKLPGQPADGLFRFATAPSSLTLREWERPTSWPCERSCPAGKYAVGDVYFAELAILRKICRNAGALFRVDVGETMRCQVDVAAYHELVAQLLAS